MQDNLDLIFVKRKGYSDSRRAAILSNIFSALFLVGNSTRNTSPDSVF